VVHATWSVAQLTALGYVWWSAWRRRRDRRLVGAVVFVLAEGGGLVIGRGHCPVGRLQEAWGDPVPFFELVLPPRAARAAVPILAVVAVAGIAAAALRPPRPSAPDRPPVGPVNPRRSPGRRRR
jgi:hypothetical protein